MKQNSAIKIYYLRLIFIKTITRQTSKLKMSKLKAMKSTQQIKIAELVGMAMLKNWEINYQLSTIIHPNNTNSVSNRLLSSSLKSRSKKDIRATVKRMSSRKIFRIIPRQSWRMRIRNNNTLISTNTKNRIYPSDKRYNRVIIMVLQSKITKANSQKALKW